MKKSLFIYSLSFFFLLFASLIQAQDITFNQNQITETFGQLTLLETDAVTITHSTSQTILAGNSVSCNAAGLHADNSYYRAFNLADFGITEDFDVTMVEIGIEQATGAGGTQPITVYLYTSNPAFPGGFPGSLTQIGTVDIDVPDQAATIFQIPVTGTAPAGSELVVEIFTPDGQTAGHSFFIGSNNLGESGPSYILSADCAITVPTPTGNIGFPGMQIVMNVIGDTGGGGTAFTDNFDSYTAGTQLCLQTTDWEPWVGSVPGSSADPFVSNAQSYSNPNSIVIISNNDVVRRHGPLTSGTWYMSFAFYIPSGNSGYFNNMNGYDPNTNVWGMDSYFDVGGTGRVDTTGGGGGTFVVPFTWVQDTWNQVIVIIDLDSPGSPAEYWIGTSPSTLTMVATWDWTQAGTKPNEIHVTDLFGAAATDEMYVDQFYFGDAMPPIIPVELTSFTGTVNNYGQVILNWQTASELNNQGFEIERRTESSEFRTIAFVEGAGTITETRNYSYLDKTADQGINYYRLKQIDFNGTYTYSDEVEVEAAGPVRFELAQNYPNPFNPTTNIQFSIPESGNVKLSVYNLVGEEVAVLVNGFSPAGTFEVTFDASNLSTGIYLYKLQSANSVQTMKMMLLK